MTASAAIDHQTANPIEVLRARAEAKVLLIANGYLDLQTAIDELWLASERDGLIRMFGADAVQRVLAESFARWHVWAEIDELEWLAELRQQQELAGILERISAPIDEPRRDHPRRAEPPPYRPAQSTIDAFWFVVGLRDPERLKAWLADHPQDAPFLLQLLKGTSDATG
jgi:hypothetical protein